MEDSSSPCSWRAGGPWPEWSLVWAGWTVNSCVSGPGSFVDFVLIRYRRWKLTTPTSKYRSIAFVWHTGLNRRERSPPSALPVTWVYWLVPQPNTYRLSIQEGQEVQWKGSYSELWLNRLMTLVSYSVFKGVISPEQLSDYLISKPWFPNHGPSMPWVLQRIYSGTMGYFTFFRK